MLLALALGLPAIARTVSRPIEGVVVHVTDGDSLWVRPPGAAEALQVRIQGIDAPEICQAFGAQAREALAGHVLNRTVQVTPRARDRYHRLVARVSLRGQDVGAWLVGGGFAWGSHWRGRSTYGSEELAAKSARRGLWQAHSPLEPRLFRQRHGSCH